VKRLERADLLDLVAYEKAREGILARTIALKAPRRVAVGDRLTFVFENRDTVFFQIQEMMRAERIVHDDKIQAELDVYNELLPGPHELSATLLIEIPEKELVRRELDRLIGIDEHVFLRVGAARVQAAFDPKQFEEERISAVQYVRFPLGPSLAARFSDPSVAVELSVEHPNYRASTLITGAARASLAADLA
jgi:hypothetical protein